MKSHVAPVVQIQVDGMIKVDQSGIRFDPCVFYRPVVSRIVMATGHGSKSSQKKSFKRGSPKISLCRSIFFPNNGEHHLVILRALLPGFPSAKVETEDRCVTWRILQILFSQLVMKPIPRARCCCCGDGGGG